MDTKCSWEPYQILKSCSYRKVFFRVAVLYFFSLSLFFIFFFIFMYTEKQSFHSQAATFIAFHYSCPFPIRPRWNQFNVTFSLQQHFTSTHIFQRYYSLNCSVTNLVSDYKKKSLLFRIWICLFLAFLVYTSPHFLIEQHKLWKNVEYFEEIIFVERTAHSLHHCIAYNLLHRIP